MKALVLPIVVPMSTAALLLLVPKRPLLQRRIALVGSIALLVSTFVLFRRVEADGIQVLQIGGWPAPGTALGVSRDAPAPPAPAGAASVRLRAP